VPNKRKQTTNKKTDSPAHDPKLMKEIGELGGSTTASRSHVVDGKKVRGSDYYAAIARRSHPRKKYVGGRPKGRKNSPKPE
jgi:general stress protein YciG